MDEKNVKLEPIRAAAWEWIIDRLGEDRVKELTGTLEPTKDALATAYPVALRIQEDRPIHWNHWSTLTTRSISARALVVKALGDILGDAIKWENIPQPIAEAGYEVEDQSQQ